MYAQRLTVPAEKKSKLEVQSTAVLVLVVHKSEPFSVDINSITELLVQSIQQVSSTFFVFCYVFLQRRFVCGLALHLDAWRVERVKFNRKIKAMVCIKS